jgi:hypothetical protein
MNRLITSRALLLKAALLQGEHSLSAWREWVELNDLEHAHITPGSYMLLPLIYSNLTCGVSAVENNSLSLDRLRGIYRHTWVANEANFRSLGAALKLLAAACIPVLLPDGAALALRFYRYHACRPVRNQTVWVRENQALAATRCLQKAGWQVLTRLPVPLAAIRNVARRAWPLRDESGHVLFVRGRYWSDREQALWAAAKPLQVGAGHGLALNLIEQFLYLSTQASRAEPGLALPFLADAAQLLRSSAAAMDWTRIQHQATAKALIRQLSMISEDLKEISLQGQTKKIGNP